MGYAEQNPTADVDGIDACRKTAILADLAYGIAVDPAAIETEGIRGVTVDHVLRPLMEMHLVRIVGRSDLPGRPFLYGTTPLFLEHFGLRDLDELKDIDPTLKRDRKTDDEDLFADKSADKPAGSTDKPAAEPAAEAADKPAADPPPEQNQP